MARHNRFSWWGFPFIRSVTSKFWETLPCNCSFYIQRRCYLRPFYLWSYGQSKHKIYLVQINMYRTSNCRMQNLISCVFTTISGKSFIICSLFQQYQIPFVFCFSNRVWFAWRHFQRKPSRAWHSVTTSMPSPLQAILISAPYMTYKQTTSPIAAISSGTSICILSCKTPWRCLKAMMRDDCKLVWA